MSNITMTRKEKSVLSHYWGMPLRCKNGNVELKKGELWGMLCSIEEGKKNAQLLIEKLES
jgi:hypothetical protein